VPTLKGFQRWLRSLRRLNPLHDAVERQAAALRELEATLRTQQRALEQHGHEMLSLAHAATRIDARLDPLAASVDALGARVEREGREETDVRNGVRLEITGICNRLDENARVAAQLADVHRALDTHVQRAHARIEEIAPPFPPLPGVGSADSAAWFHSSLESRFRGPYEVIRERLRTYLPYVAGLAAAVRARRAIDVGCGRGEWLELLAREGIDAIGVDDNAVSVERCAARGLHAEQGDALAFLRRQPDGETSLVTAFHVVEHLAPATMMAILLDAWRALVPGGLLILETPNPENVLVAAYSFHMDPTHRHPIPAPLLRAFVEFAKYEVVDTLALQPDDTIAAAAEREGWPPTLAHLLAGARDIGIVARKPSA